jgi:hypothetical protein
MLCGEGDCFWLMLLRFGMRVLVLFVLFVLLSCLF